MSIQDHLILEQIAVGPMQNFAYLLGCKTSRKVALVDPAWEIDSLLERIAERGYQLTAALVTHYHPDHCGGSFGHNRVPGLAELLEKQPVKTYIHQLEADGLKKVTGVSDTDLVKVSSGDKLDLGNIQVEFLHTPGHTPGSQCFRIKQALVSGDTLFIDSCGRVDLPGSNPEDMYHSIQKLASLPDDTLLLPGHNYSSVPQATLEEAKRINTYMQINDLDTWKQLMSH